jgi:hypothetical protein
MFEGGKHNFPEIRSSISSFLLLRNLCILAKYPRVAARKTNIVVFLGQKYYSPRMVAPHHRLEEPRGLRASPMGRHTSDAEKQSRMSICVTRQTYFDRASVCVSVCSQRSDPFFVLQTILKNIIYYKLYKLQLVEA